MLRSHLKGVSWQNPLVNIAVHAVDPVDYVVRTMNGRGHIPRYSARVRSVGIKGDIGAKDFQKGGRKAANLMRTYAALTPESKILEIGCGCGSNALGLGEFLDDGNYTGMDIERVSLEAARGIAPLRAKGFRFDFLDVRNGAYNPDGKYLATEYVFPYPDACFDVIFFASVFTHMLTDEVLNYATQIGRVLKPGGRCMFTAYLLDRPTTLPFPFTAQEHSYMNETIPEIAVAYHSKFLYDTFAKHDMACPSGPLWGSIHGGEAQSGGLQDIMVFTKQG